MTLDTALTAAIVDLDDHLHAEWEAVAVQNRAAPFSRPEWVRAWAAMNGTDVAVVVVRRGADLEAVYPVVARGGRISSAADWHVPELDPVGGVDAVPAIVAAMATGRYRVIVDMATEATAPVFARALAEAGFRVRIRERARPPWVDLSAGWTVFQESVSTKKWRELRRRRRRLDEIGVVSFAEHDGSKDLDALLDEGFAVEGSGWKGAAGTAMLADAAVAAFYRRVATDLAGRGSLRLRFLRLDGRAIAFDLAFVHDGAEWLLKTGFDPNLAAWSPGSLLRAEALERACSAGCSRYEFLGTDDAWKREWTDRTRAIVQVIGTRPGVRGSAADLLSRLLRVVRIRVFAAVGRRR